MHLTRAPRADICRQLTCEAYRHVPEPVSIHVSTIYNCSYAKQLLPGVWDLQAHRLQNVPPHIHQEPGSVWHNGENIYIVVLLIWLFVGFKLKD